MYFIVCNRCEFANGSRPVYPMNEQATGRTSPISIRLATLIFCLLRASSISRFWTFPIRYKERVYGQTNIQRWKHGWLLLQMVGSAAAKLKFI